MFAGECDISMWTYSLSQAVSSHLKSPSKWSVLTGSLSLVGAIRNGDLFLFVCLFVSLFCLLPEMHTCWALARPAQKCNSTLSLLSTHNKRKCKTHSYKNKNNINTTKNTMDKNSKPKTSAEPGNQDFSA